MADITFEDVLKFAEQLTPEERARLIAELQAKRTKQEPDQFRNKRTVNNLAELHEVIFDKNSRFFNNDDLFIFRGQADSNWGLVPSIFRKFALPPTSMIEFQGRFVVDTAGTLIIAGVAGLENKIYDEFFQRIRAYPQLRVNFHDPWEMLCLAQHFGVPTRLLDWTGNLNIAAYLCVAEVLQTDKDGAIWCLNASRITEHKNPRGDDESFNGAFYNREERISRIDDLPLPTSFFSRWKKSPKSLEDTAYGFRVLRAPAVDDRIKNQDSFFTVDVTKGSIVSNPDDAVVHTDQIVLCKDYLFKIIIPSNAKESIKDKLQRLGIDYSAVFPDLFGLGAYFRDLRETYLQIWAGENAINGD